MKKQKVDVWKHILKTKGYAGEERCIITADEMKQCKKTWTGPDSQFEPRLLAYQTSAACRPPSFMEAGLYLLPIQNGTYMLCKQNIYMPLDYTHSTDEIVVVPKNTESIVLKIGDSETSRIDNLRYAGVFERPELLGEPILYGPLLNGRHRCSLTTKLGGHTIVVDGVQYETDACYESRHKILLIEGKSSEMPIDSFNIRQLYFPYRAIYDTVGSAKSILCIFIHKLGSLYHIWKYAFTDPHAMDSIVCVGHQVYMLEA